VKLPEGRSEKSCFLREPLALYVLLPFLREDVRPPEGREEALPLALPSEREDAVTITIIYEDGDGDGNGSLPSNEPLPKGVASSYPLGERSNHHLQ